MTTNESRPGKAESRVKVTILVAIGGMAGAASFTHVHDLTVAHGQPDWIGWANAVAIELMALYLGLEIRARRRTGRPVKAVGAILAAFAFLSLAAQVAEAEPSVWGWIVAAVPSLAFLSLVKVVLSSHAVTTSAPASEPEPAASPATVPVQPVEREQVVYAPVPAGTGSRSVLPPLGIMHPDRVNGERR